jgi:2,5-diamino-6-(ribosylamino)-4(3H)-pyrimidinone 5'-phosphate reductase
MSEITADGKLTLRRGASSKRLTQYMDPLAETLLHRARARSDAIMVGANTVRIDDPRLTVRRVEGRSPLRVIPSSRADIPLDSKVLDAAAPTLIAVSAAAPAARVAALRGRGAEVLVAGADCVDLTCLMQRLREDYGVRTLMVEGGSALASEMFRRRLIDEICLIHLPFVVGGEDTPSLAGGLPLRDESELIRLVLKAHYLCGENLVTEHEVRYGSLR